MTVKKHWVRLLLCLLFAAVPAHSFAQSETPTPTAPPQSDDAPPFAPPATEIAPGPGLSIDVSLADLFLPQLSLASPQGSAEVFFTVPDDWQPIDGSLLVLDFDYFETETAEDAPSAVSLLNIFLDETLIFNIALDAEDVGQGRLEVPIPTTLLDDPDNRFHTLTFNMDMRDHCAANSSARLSADGEQGVMTFAYREYLPLLDLAAYPRPFYNRPLRVETETVVLVLPADPTPSDVQAAVSVGSGLGLLTDGNIDITTVTQDALTDTQRDENHLILIGQPATQPLIETILEQADAPLSYDSEAGFEVMGQTIGENEGLLYLAAHPQNASRAALLVTGASATALERAGQALGGPPATLGISGSLAIISDISPPIADVTAPPPRTATLRTLQELGVEQDIVLSGVGQQRATLDFQVSSGGTVTEGAYLDIDYNNALLLDGTRSDLTVLIDDIPIASLPLEQRTRVDGVVQVEQRQARITIPPELIDTGGSNTLAFVANIDGDWACDIPARDSAWVTVSRSSLLAMPQQAAETTFPPRVSSFPLAFNRLPNLANVWINLPAEPAPYELDQAVRAAAALGTGLQGGNGLVPAVNLGELPANTDVALYDFIVIGLPTENPLLREVNSSLSQPFLPESNTLEQVLDDVSYRVLPGVELGVLQTVISPWNADRVVLVISGTGPDGLMAAGEALFGDTFNRRELAGDVVFTGGRSVSAVDTFDFTNAVDILSQADQAAFVTETPAVLTVTATSDAQDMALNPDAEPTLLFTVEAEPTPFPTLPAVSTEIASVTTLEQPAWVNVLLIVAGIMLLGSVAFSVVRFLDQRRST